MKLARLIGHFYPFREIFFCSDFLKKSLYVLPISCKSLICHRKRLARHRTDIGQTLSRVLPKFCIDVRVRHLMIDQVLVRKTPLCNNINDLTVSPASL